MDPARHRERFEKIARRSEKTKSIKNIKENSNEMVFKRTELNPAEKKAADHPLISTAKLVIDDIEQIEERTQRLIDGVAETGDMKTQLKMNFPGFQDFLKVQKRINFEKATKGSKVQMEQKEKLNNQVCLDIKDKIHEFKWNLISKINYGN